MKRLGLALALLSWPAAAQDLETAQTLRTKRPAAFRAFQSALPDGYQADTWAHDLDGTSEPIETVQLDGRPYVLGFSCKPHDCSDNALAFLTALDGSRAIVMVKSTERTGGVAEVYGTSTPRERTLLKDLLAIPR